MEWDSGIRLPDSGFLKQKKCPGEKKCLREERGKRQKAVNIKIPYTKVPGI
jgi:hypothetical protein